MLSTHCIDTPEGRISFVVKQTGTFITKSEDGVQEELEDVVVIQDKEAFKRLMIFYSWTSVLVEIPETYPNTFFLRIVLSDPKYGSPAFKLLPYSKKQKRYSIDTILGSIYFKVYKPGFLLSRDEVLDKNVAMPEEVYHFKRFLRDYLWTAVSIEEVKINETKQLFLCIDLLDEYYGRPSFRLYPCTPLIHQ